MGKFHKILEPGLNILLPIIDKVKYVQILKELAIDVPQQNAVTSGTFMLADEIFENIEYLCSMVF